MKFLFGLFIVFLVLGYVAAPAMACDHDCGNCPHSGDCNGHDDGECGDGHDCGGDCGDDHDGDDHGGCTGGSCPI
ncbi:MAG: hypothetical protein Kow0029_08110 [Candidatus Rifleibacteriota bacterium]